MGLNAMCFWPRHFALQHRMYDAVSKCSCEMFWSNKPHTYATLGAVSISKNKIRGSVTKERLHPEKHWNPVCQRARYFSITSRRHSRQANKRITAFDPFQIKLHPCFIRAGMCHFPEAVKVWNIWRIPLIQQTCAHFDGMTDVVDKIAATRQRSADIHVLNPCTWLAA